MIDGNEEEGYTLTCDECEETADEYFEVFMDAVQFKRDNEWKSIKNKKTNEWSEVCPTCAKTPGVIKKFMGVTSR